MTVGFHDDSLPKSRSDCWYSILDQGNENESLSGKLIKGGDRKKSPRGRLKFWNSLVGFLTFEFIETQLIPYYLYHQHLPLVVVGVVTGKGSFALLQVY